jgi:hypothetical protein
MKDKSIKTDQNDDRFNENVDRLLAQVASWLTKRIRRGHPRSKFGNLYERTFMLRDARALVRALESGGETGVVVEA